MGRTSERTKYRSPCTITIGGRRHNGFVLDFSNTGLFIQTSAKPEPGQRLDLELVMRGEHLSMHVEVARRKQVPPQLLTVAHGGIGVRILSAPESFYQILGETVGPTTGGRAGVRAPGGAAVRESRAASGRPTREGASKGRVRGESTSSKPTPSPAAHRFRVRVKQVTGTRTRTLDLRGPDEAAVRREALDELGDEWKILEIERL